MERGHPAAGGHCRCSFRDPSRTEQGPPYDRRSDTGPAVPSYRVPLSSTSRTCRLMVVQREIRRTHGSKPDRVVRGPASSADKGTSDYCGRRSRCVALTERPLCPTRVHCTLLRPLPPQKRLEVRAGGPPVRTRLLSVLTCAITAALRDAENAERPVFMAPRGAEPPVAAVEETRLPTSPRQPRPWTASLRSRLLIPAGVEGRRCCPVRGALKGD